MKISEIRDTYYEATSSLSEIVRKLAFAGIAIIWIFRVGGDGSGGVSYSSNLLWPLGLLVAGLAFDLFQYAYKSIVYGILNTVSYKKHGDNEAEVPVSGALNWITIIFFWLKTLSVFLAYCCLIQFIYMKL